MLDTGSVESDFDGKDQGHHQERFDGFVGHLRQLPDASDTALSSRIRQLGI
jgi:hypothetical protein